MASVERPEYVPDPSIDRAAMEELQRSLASEARWTDDLAFDPADVLARRPFASGDGADGTVQRRLPSGVDRDELPGEPGLDRVDRASDSDGRATDPDERASDSDDRLTGPDELDESDQPPVIAGVDQAFREDEAVSVVVATRGGEVVETVHATAPLEIPYVPGLLSFREGGAILAALQALETEPDCLLVDGSGRIHYREAGLATHVGVTCDLPAVGVAKSLLCGEPVAATEGLAVGDVVPIAADDEMTTAAGTVVGAAVQTRQFDAPNSHVNPLYVSPGHRVDWETAADLALATTAGYKLPEPIRRADARVGTLAASE